MFRETLSSAVNGQFKPTDGDADIDDMDVKGLAYQSSTRTLFLANDDPDSNKPDQILGTVLPENTGVDLTIIGDYTGELSTVADSTVVTSTPQVSFSINRNPDVVVQLTNPQDGFIATTPQTNITGRLSDPAIEEVAVDIELPFTRVIDDPVDANSTTKFNVVDDAGSAFWHIACDEDASQGFPIDGSPRFSSSLCSWRYSVPAPDGTASSFDTGAPTSGNLVTIDAITVRADTTLSFSTGYSTELPSAVDQKIVEVARVRTDAQGNEFEDPFTAILQIVGRGGGGAAAPSNADASFQFVELDPLFINPSLVPVTFSLAPFEGDRIRVRFRFDSINRFANDGEGWYVDDIVVEGSALRTETVATTLLVTPQVDGGVEFFRTFDLTFVLSEGEITLAATGTQPYGPFLSGSDAVSGFVDTLVPIVTLAGISDETNESIQTLTGTIVEPTLVSLDITQETSAGTQTIRTITSEPPSGTFSVGVSVVVLRLCQ